MKSQEEIIKELSGQVSIYKEEIRRLNNAILKKNYSAEKLREKLEKAKNENDFLLSLVERDVSNNGDSWTADDLISENPDMGKV